MFDLKSVSITLNQVDIGVPLGKRNFNKKKTTSRRIILSLEFLFINIIKLAFGYNSIHLQAKIQQDLIRIEIYTINQTNKQ